MIKIENYTLADLAARLNSGDFWRGGVIPITKHRAISQIRNPRANPEDVALLVAYNNDNIVGYIGVLPDSVFLNGEKQRLGWLTAWWANPDSKYAGIGLLLMSRASKLYGGEVGASGFSAVAKRVYDGSKQFITVQESVSIRAFVRANMRELLPRKVPLLKRAKAPLATLDFLLNILCDLRLQFWKWRLSRREAPRLEYIAEVDSETADFVRELQERELSKRGAAEINWIAQYPWVLAAPVAQRAERNFYFSASAKQSACYMLKVFSSDNRMIAFVMLRLTEGHLTVPYCYMPEQYADEVFRVIGEHAVALRVHTLTICRSQLRESLIRLKFPCIATKEQSRSWIVGKVYQPKLQGKYEMQDGDGDCAFV